MTASERAEWIRMNELLVAIVRSGHVDAVRPCLHARNTRACGSLLIYLEETEAAMETRTADEALAFILGDYDEKKKEQTP